MLLPAMPDADIFADDAAAAISAALLLFSRMSLHMRELTPPLLPPLLFDYADADYCLCLMRAMRMLFDELPAMLAATFATSHTLHVMRVRKVCLMFCR